MEDRRRTKKKRRWRSCITKPLGSPSPSPRYTDSTSASPTLPDPRPSMSLLTSGDFATCTLCIQQPSLLFLSNFDFDCSLNSGDVRLASSIRGAMAGRPVKEPSKIKVIDASETPTHFRGESYGMVEVEVYRFSVSQKPIRDAKSLKMI